MNYYYRDEAYDDGSGAALLIFLMIFILVLTIIVLPPVSVVMMYLAINRRDGTPHRELRTTFKGHPFLAFLTFTNVVCAALFLLFLVSVKVSPDVNVIRSFLNQAMAKASSTAQMTGFGMAIYSVPTLLFRKSEKENVDSKN